MCCWLIFQWEILCSDAFWSVLSFFIRLDVVANICEFSQDILIHFQILRYIMCAKPELIHLLDLRCVWIVLLEPTQSDGVVCFPCLPGYYSNGGGQMCEACGTGTYSAFGASQCSNCPAGTFGPNTNASHCELIPAGRVLVVTILSLWRGAFAKLSSQYLFIRILQPLRWRIVSQSTLPIFTLFWIHLVQSR